MSSRACHTLWVRYTNIHKHHHPNHTTSDGRPGAPTCLRQIPGLVPASPSHHQLSPKSVSNYPSPLLREDKKQHRANTAVLCNPSTILGLCAMCFNLLVHESFLQESQQTLTPEVAFLSQRNSQVVVLTPKAVRQKSREGRSVFQ